MCDAQMGLLLHTKRGRGERVCKCIYYICTRAPCVCVCVLSVWGILNLELYVYTGETYAVVGAEVTRVSRSVG